MTMWPSFHDIQTKAGAPINMSSSLTTDKYIIVTDTPNASHWHRQWKRLLPLGCSCVSKYHKWSLQKNQLHYIPVVQVLILRFSTFPFKNPWQASSKTNSTIPLQTLGHSGMLLVGSNASRNIHSNSFTRIKQTSNFNENCKQWFLEK